MKTQEEIEKSAIDYAKTQVIRGKNLLEWDDKPEQLIARYFTKGYTQCQEDVADILKITRFEVIDESGRLYTRHNCKVELSYQDDGRTLKVFLSKKD